MGRYLIRRLLTAIPTLIAISFVIFAILDLAPSDPTGNLPLTIPPEVKQQIRESLGLGQPFHIRYLKWMQQFFITEPLNILEETTGITIGDSESRFRLRSWQTRGPVIDLIVERMPQTLWVVGLAYLVSVIIAIPLGVISAVKQYSWVDQAGTIFSMIGFSVPTFFTGLLAIIIFSVHLGWFPHFMTPPTKSPIGRALSSKSSRLSCRSAYWPCSKRPPSTALLAPPSSIICLKIMCVPSEPRDLGNIM